MKKIVRLMSIIFLLSTSISVVAQDTIYFHEGFEKGIQPEGWISQYVSGIYDWEYQDGGYSTSPTIPGSGHPPYAFQGLFNAMFHVQSLSGESTRLITPPINLGVAIKPELNFWHAQDERYTLGEFRHDELKVYIRKSISDPWVLMKEYTELVEDWTERVILIPDTLISSTTYVAFEGKTNNGYGVCIDSVYIIERGILAKYVDNLDIKQASTDFVPTGSQKNPIIRIDISIKGNDGPLKLDSIVVNSLNTSDDDIEVNGVKLYASSDTLFKNSSQIGTATNFVGGIASFDNLNYNLPIGLSSIWVTYDIKLDNNHELHEHYLDAKINKENIRIKNTLYPFIDKSPSGKRVLYEALLLDDFEADKGWVLTGEFQRNIPMGKGGSDGRADPSSAVSGSYVLGTDLTGLGAWPGDYEIDLKDTAYKATSPYINCKYYKDLYLYFNRWLNVDGNDGVSIQIATTTKDNWKTYWHNSGTSITNQWTPIRNNIGSFVNRKDSVQLRFTVDSTNDFYNFSGWNIDDVILVGNFLSRDVGITNWIAPMGGCGLTDEEYVTVTIKNFAGLAVTEPLPLSFSFDGGTTIYYDTIDSPNIPIDGSLIYQINKPIDLTTPGWYNNVYARTNFPGDEDATNDKFDTAIFVSPTYALPYTQNFEANNGYFLSGGTNSSWQYGNPNGVVINGAASGSYVWVTSLNSSYNNNEDSYIESPCFNFAGIDYPVFEFKSKGLSQDTTDGLAVYYSIDDGDNWAIAPNNNDFNWNWYNESYIESLDDEGIDSTDNIWKTFRQVLPPATANQSQVKFRFVFKSNFELTFEGFGIDDIKVFEAPANVGVTDFIYPYDTCEWSDTTHIIVKIKNFGLDTIETGSKIPVGYKFKNGTTVRDTLTLSSNLLPDATVNFKFNSTVDMSYAGDYAFSVFTTLESNPYFYSTLCNDTVRDTISVFGMPRYDIGNIMGTPEPIDTFIVAGTGYSNYNWTGGGTPDITAPVDTLYVTAEGWYKVTVTNSYGCTAKDSVRVVPSLIDFKMDSLYTTMKDSCERVALTEISVHVLNKGFADFNPGDSVFFGYRINNEPIVYDTLFLTELFADTSPDDTAYFTFAEKADFRTPGEYTFKVFTNFGKDLEPSDDTITAVINTWGFPDVELEFDSITSSQADTLLLIATPGYNTYSWNTDPVQTNDTLVPPTNESSWYVVTVTDIHSCGSDKDSTFINTYDYGITRIVSPVDTCSHTATTAIELNVFNYSGNNYLAGDSIKFKFNFNNAGWISEKYILTSPFASEDSMKITLSNTINASAVDEYTLLVTIDSDLDANHTNDTVSYSFETWGFPDVNLPYDTIWTTQADTIVLVANTGFATYEWSDASDNDSLVVYDNYSQKFVVTVTDIHGCGSDKDSTQIVTYNLSAKTISAPINDCAHTNNESVTIVIENNSNDILLSGESIDVGYIFNNGVPVIETILLASDFNPTQTITYTFSQKVNMLAEGTYTLKIFTDFLYDVVHENDTIYEGIKTIGYPVVEIGPDIYTYQPDTVVFVASAGSNYYYLWNEGTRNDSLFVSKPESFEYIVTVTDINGCATKDTASVFTTNVAATSLIAPTSDCELSNAANVTVEITNTCSDTLLTGESIEIRYKIGSGSFVIENHVLGSDLLPNGTTQHTFAATVDISSESSYDFTLFAKSAIDVFLDDTTTANIYEAGYPVYELGDDIYTSTPVGTVLAVPAGFASYEWQDGSTNNTFSITYPASAKYKVTVANELACETSDSLYVYTFNVAASALVAPFSTCELTNAETVIVELINNSQDTLLAGNSLTVSYILGTTPIVSENMILAADLLPDSTVQHSFALTLDLSSETSYDFKVFAKYAIDVNTDDTISVNVIESGYPVVDLGEDTLTTNPVGILLTAPAGFASYEWQDGSTNETFTISYPASAEYYVTVANIYGCETTDTINVYTYNIAATNLVSPFSTCELTNAETVIVELINNSQDTIMAGDSITVSYVIGTGSLVSENMILTDDLFPDSTVQHSFAETVDLSSEASYDFKIFGKYAIDVNTDDTLSVNVIESGYPVVDLGEDTLTTNPVGIVLTAPAGFASYLWQDGSTNETFTISYPASAEYYVTVANIYGCETTDTINVYTYNIAATNLVSPFSTCELTNAETVIVELINNSQDTIMAGDSITVSYILGTAPIVSENMILAADLLPDSTVEYTFATTLDLTTGTSFDFKLFAKYQVDVDTDDTSEVNIIEAGYPVVDLGTDIYSTNPVGTILVAQPGYASYIWQDGSVNDTLIISYSASAEYEVTVANAFGCETEASINVYTYNLAVDSLIAPVSQCELSNAEQLIVGIINNSQDTLLVGESVSVSYILNGGTAVNETFNLTEDLYPDSIVEYSFTQTANMLANQLHEIMVFAMLADTDVFLDDTLTVNIDVQKPDLDLGSDVYTTVEEVTLDAEAGYTSYLWFDGSSEQTYVVNVNNQTPNYYYSVTVENSLGCSATDSVLVSFDVTPDLSISALVSPESDCLSDSLYNVDIEITNSGGLDIAASNAISVSYQIDDGTPVTENHVLAAALFAGDKVVHRFTNTISFTTANTYQFKMYLAYAGDVTHTNDTLESSVTISAPNFAFSTDTLKVSVFPYVLDAGSWSSYLWQNGSTSRQFSVTSNGWYKVTIKDDAGCNATDSVYVMLLTGLDRIIHGADFMVSFYPNPVQEQLNINIEAYKPIDMIIDLLNTQGQVVYTRQIKNIEQVIEKLSVDEFAQGVYYIRFTVGKESFVRKVVIQ